MAGANVVGSAVWEMGMDTGGFSAGMAFVSQEIGKIVGELGGATAAAKGFSGALAAIGAAALGVASVSVMTAARTETLGVAMEAVTRATGNSLKVVREQEEALKKQGIATQEARTILTRFMQANLEVADASRIARVAQDLAVIGNMNSSEAAEILTQSISSQNVVLLKQFGITTGVDQIFERYANTIGKTGDQLTDVQKRQAFVNQILLEGQKVAGVYERSMETAGKKLGSMTRVIQEAQNAIGAVFLPLFAEMIDGVTNFLKAITPENVERFRMALEAWAPVLIGIVAVGLLPLIGALQTMAIAAVAAIAPLLPFIAIGAAVGLAFKLITDQVFGLNSGLTVLVASIQVVIAALVGLFRTFHAVMTMQFGEVKNVIYDTVGSMSNIVSGAQQKIAGAVKGSQDKQVAAVEDGARRQEEVTKQLSSKQIKQLADETEKFADEMAKRKKSFEEQLADMIFAHLDKVANLKKDIAEENRDFKAKMDERVADFRESTAQMLRDHTEKMGNIKRDIKELDEDYALSNEERAEDAALSISEETREHEKKVDDIQEQIDKELAKGKNASQTKLAILREQLVEENEAYDEKVADIEIQLARETNRAIIEYERRKTALEEQLAAEEAAYTEQTVKAAERQAQEDLKLAEAHTRRITELDATLSTEEAILRAHQSEVDAVKDKAREDDLTRLARRYSDENAEALKQHNKRMADIRNESTAQGAQAGSAFNQGISGITPSILGTVSDIGNQIGQQLKNSASGAARDAGREMVNSFINSARDRFNTAGNWLAGLFPFSGVAHMLGIPGFADGVKNFGGGLAMVGERGPELVSLPRGSDVYPADRSERMMQSSGRGNQTIYITIEKVGDMQDVQAIGRELGFRAGLIPEV